MSAKFPAALFCSVREAGGKGSLKLWLSSGHNTAHGNTALLLTVMAAESLGVTGLQWRARKPKREVP